MSGWVAGAAVVGAVAGGAIQANGAKKAANTQAASADRATQAQADQYYQTREDQAPYREAGYKALTGAENLLASYKAPSIDAFKSDPYYQWEQQEAAKAVQGSAAARGGLYSGATLRRLGDRAQMVARGGLTDYSNRQESAFGNQYNRFASLAGIGQTGVSQTGNAGMNFANNVSGNLIGAGNALAAGSLASSNAWANALNGTTSYAKNYLGKNGTGVGNAGYGDYSDPSWFSQVQTTY